MDELELEASGSGDHDGANFIPCVRWVRRGVAKAQPEKVKLNPEELAAVIEQTKRELQDADEAEGGGAEDDGDDAEVKSEEEEDKVKVEKRETSEVKLEKIEEDGVSGVKKEVKNGEVIKVETKVKKEKEETKVEKQDVDIDMEYDMENYDRDDQPGTLLGIGDLIIHSDPRQDPYLNDPELDDDASDVDDVLIKPTDNLILVGHVEGNASILEVYVYNDVEDALYVHHDILLPSFPLALEWMSYDAGEEVKGNMVAVGSMNPIIEVWDLDLIDCLEPAFKLGRKASKKRNVKAIGHKDAVLSLAWNHHVEHVLASGSVDETVMLWDMSQGTVASTLRAHKEKVQALQWHPFEAQTLLTGCCDKTVRVFDCRTDDSFRSWKAEGEVEKVIWNHFNPFTFLTATDTGHVHMIDVRQESKPLWTLKAHSDGINGMTLSTQCPDCLVTVSTDKCLKVWDVADNQPKCVLERSMKLGRLHCVDGCPDAPFVVCVGGDKGQDNLKVWDIREAAAVRESFGNRLLKNPLGVSSFGFSTANEAEPVDTMEATDALESLSMEPVLSLDNAATQVSKGAGAKFKKKDKKKKKKNF